MFSCSSFLFIHPSFRYTTLAARKKQNSLRWSDYYYLRTDVVFIHRSVHRSCLFIVFDSPDEHALKQSKRQSLFHNRHQRLQTPSTTMHFLTTALSLLSLASSLQVLASPLSFTDIERRWSAGESDVSPTPLHINRRHPLTRQNQASIHAQHNPRSASPAWPLAITPRSSSPETNAGAFAESYDAVTQQGVIGRRSMDSSALSARIRDFATRLLRSKGQSQMIAERGETEDAAPVLRPRKVRYSFTS